MSEKVKCPNLADWLGENSFHIHRGLANVDGQLVAFGNDGYTTDEKSRREVQLLRERLTSLGLEEVSFCISTEDGYTWAMTLKNLLNRSFEAVEAKVSDVLWEGWFGKPLSELSEDERVFHHVQSVICS